LKPDKTEGKKSEPTGNDQPGPVFDTQAKGKWEKKARKKHLRKEHLLSKKKKKGGKKDLI